MREKGGEIGILCFTKICLFSLKEELSFSGMYKYLLYTIGKGNFTEVLFMFVAKAYKTVLHLLPIHTCIETVKPHTRIIYLLFHLQSQIFPCISLILIL